MTLCLFEEEEVYFHVEFNWRSKKIECRIDAATAEVISELGQHFLIKRPVLERVLACVTPWGLDTHQMLPLTM